MENPLIHCVCVCVCLGFEKQTASYALFFSLQNHSPYVGCWHKKSPCGTLRHFVLAFKGAAQLTTVSVPHGAKWKCPVTGSPLACANLLVCARRSCSCDTGGGTAAFHWPFLGLVQWPKQGSNIQFSADPSEPACALCWAEQKSFI